MRRFVSHRAHRVDRVDDQALSQPAGPRKWRSGTLPRRRDGCADLDLLRLQRLWTERPLQRMRRGESRSLLLRRGRGRRPVSVCGGESLEAPGAVGRRRRARDRIGNVHNGRARQRIGNVQNVAFVWGRRAIAHLLEFFHGVSGVSLARLWSQADVRADCILYVRILRRRVAAFTCVYLLAYGAGRFLTPVLSQDRFDRACFIYQSYSVVSALVLLVSPATVNGLPSGRWPAPLPFCILVAAQGFFLGGFKGLMPCWLKGLWRWMDADPEFAHYDSAPAFNFAFSMTNLALCIAAAVGPVTAWTAYVGSPDVSQSDLDSGRATGHDYELWYYGAGGMQLLAAVALVVPGAVPRFEPPADLA
mmetsp:Transcript_32287/g.99896  ORF Transcript_32287/g.99896 Transcript_32287/m.99896 type:complete len:361 (+) Transcript_32287:600-1682(+)